MTYDELHSKLLECIQDYKKLYGKEPETLSDILGFLDKQLVKRKSKGAKSLRGLNL